MRVAGSSTHFNINHGVAERVPCHSLCTSLLHGKSSPPMQIVQSSFSLDKFFGFLFVWALEIGSLTLHCNAAGARWRRIRISLLEQTEPFRPSCSSVINDLHSERSGLEVGAFTHNPRSVHPLKENCYLTLSWIHVIFDSGGI